MPQTLRQIAEEAGLPYSRLQKITQYRPDLAALGVWFGRTKAYTRLEAESLVAAAREYRRPAAA